MTDGPVEVVVIGDALLDVTATLHEPMRTGEDVAAAVAPHPGGQGANVAVRLARRGIGVSLVCALAGDVSGRLLREALTADRVNLAPVEVAATGSVVVIVDEAGERTMLSQRALFADRLDVDLVPDAGWTVVSGYLLTEGGAPGAAAALGRRATRRVLLGCAVSADGRKGWRAAATALRADLLIMNADEAERLAPLDELASNVVVTSAEGATGTLGGMTSRVQASRDGTIRDATGAGDAFAAALVARLAHAAWPPPHAAWEAALGEAVRVAGEVARARGAQAPIPGEMAGASR